MPWEGRCDLIIYDSSQFGSDMWYLREDGTWAENVSLVSTQLKDIYGYPKVFDWNGGGTLDLITLKQGFHLIGGTPIPEFRYADQLRIEDELLRQLPGSITQIDFVRLNDGWSALVSCDNWSQYWSDSTSPWDKPSSHHRSEQKL